jgi:hypothetical protein
MQKRSFLTVVMFLIGMFMTGAYAQTHTVSGLVKDKEMGEPLVGVSVSVKGTKNATMTDLNGNYTIQTSAKDVLEFKYVGMKNAEETVGNRKIINVSLSPNAESLGEVVVTAMGIKRQSETLTYSAQTVGGKDVNDIKSINMINSLQGKSAGLQITPNSTGAGGSSKILFRGNKSISGSNQPLIVIDGVPTMTNTTTSQVSSDYGGERDAGDVMSTINPDDIASITLLLNKLVPMGEQVNLFKFRGSYSIVGNDVPIYMSNPRYTLGGSGAISAPDKAAFRTLKPEKTHSLEFGFDGTFLNNRLDFSFTYYKTNTKNQFFSVSAPYESGLRNRYVNAGNVQNQGFEASVGWHQQFNADFSWSTNFNISYNENKIKELVEGLENGLTIASWQGAKVVLNEGGSYGDLYVRQIKRDEAGKPVKNADGKPVLMGDNIDEMKYAGNMNAKVNFGWSNTFHYKDFTLSFLIDGKFGGRVLSATEATLDGWGVSERTGNARNAGKVVVDGVEFDPQLWYTETGSSNFNNSYATEFYVYKGTNVRMRELSLGYTFRNLFGNGKNLTAALIARNLFFFYKDAPCDPDVSMGTGNGVQGVDIFNLPSSRSLGLNLKLNF